MTTYHGQPLLKQWTKRIYGQSKYANHNLGKVLLNYRIRNHDSNST